jgi:hypothetical protein
MDVVVSENPEEGDSMFLETQESAHETTQYLNPEGHIIEKISLFTVRTTRNT